MSDQTIADLALSYAQAAADRDAYKARAEQAEKEVDHQRREIFRQVTERQKAEAKCAAMVEALEEADGCFEAALAEGWLDAIGNEDIDRITDLWERRISFARTAIMVALSRLSDTPDAEGRT